MATGNWCSIIGPLSISNEATSIYSTWFSALSPRGYCDRSFLLECAFGLYFREADSEECWEDISLEGVFEFELGLEVRSVPIMGGLGDLDGLLECLDIAEGDLEGGKEDRDVRRFAGALPLELQVSVVAVVPLVVGRCWTACIACFVAFVLW
jgi:hypothetical protein